MQLLDEDNQVRQGGRIGSVSTRGLPNGSKVTNFTLRVEKVRKLDAPKDGKNFEVLRGYWLKCEAWERVGEDCARLKVGQLVHVTGELIPLDDYVDTAGVAHKGQLGLRVQRVYLDPRDLADFEPRERRSRSDVQPAAQ